MPGNAWTTAQRPSKKATTLTSWLTSCTPTKPTSVKPAQEHVGATEDAQAQAAHARSVWAGINRAAMSMGCSNYGSIVPSVSTNGPNKLLGKMGAHGEAAAPGTTLESIFKRPVPVPVKPSTNQSKGAPTGWRKVTHADGTKKAAFFKNGVQLKGQRAWAGGASSRPRA